MRYKNVELTDEQAAQLQAYSPIPVDNEFLFVPQIYKKLDKAVWPVFTLKYIGGLDLIMLEDKLRGRAALNAGKIETITQRGEFTRNVCVQGIVSWKNYWDVRTQNEVKFDEDNVEASIQKLPPDLLYELSNAITERVELSEDEKLGLK